VAINNKKNDSASFIVTCFNEFYKQVLKYKKFISSKPWEKEEDETTSSPRATAEYVISKLQTFLEEQATATSFGETIFSANYYAEAQFVMVALADEIFLNLEWPGKDYWESNLLEQRFYGTHSAGQVFFDKLDLLLANKDPARIDLGILYLSALALGFQGKYRHFDEDEALVSYRKNLFIFINRKSPSLFRRKSHLFPEAYGYTLEGNVPKDLPTLRNWYFVFLSLGFVYLLSSYVVWYKATADILRIVNRIITYSDISG
jgi:type VI secretion system protein ImpK